MGFGVSSVDAKRGSHSGHGHSFDFRLHPRYLEFLSGLTSHIIRRPALPGAMAPCNSLADSPRRREASGKRTFIELERGVSVAFQLVYGDHDLVLPLALDSVAEERLIDLMSVPVSDGNGRADLARRITDAISTLVECQIIPPTDKQVKYAVAIARELSITLSPEVLQYRTAMTVFLGTHAQTYRQRKGRVR